MDGRTSQKQCSPPTIAYTRLKIKNDRMSDKQKKRTSDLVKKICKQLLDSIAVI